jgi:hypothetical protein
VVLAFENGFSTEFRSPIAAFGMDMIGPEIQVGEPLFDGIAEKRLRLITHKRDAQRGDFHLPNVGVQVLCQIAEPPSEFLSDGPQVLRSLKLL